MIYINGKFLSKPMSGVIRFAQEVVKQFDKEEYKDKFIVLADKGVKGNFKFLKTFPWQSLGCSETTKMIPEKSQALPKSVFLKNS